MAKHVLVTGFEPFAGDKVNPSEMLARTLDGRMIAGRVVAVRVLPYETRTLRERFESLLAQEQPDIAIALAQAGGRPSLAMERVAVNVTDFEVADNQGVLRKGDVIARGGADARLSNLPFDRVLDAWREQGVPGYVSNSAGTSLGNQALYELLGLTESAAPPVMAGLLHVPYLPAQAMAAGAESSPSMSLELMKKGLEALIETVVGWVEHRTPESAKTPQRGKPAMWIPRGVKEVER